MTDLSQIPSAQEVAEELAQLRYRKRYLRNLRSTLYALLVVAAVAVLVAVFLLPVLRIYGHSMTPGLEDGDIVLSLKQTDPEPGDVIAFYYNNKVLVKRVIATAGDWVDIDMDGNVSVNQVPLEEPYLDDKALGDYNITLPHQVPDGRYFVMGDHRSVSVDSRNAAVGGVAEEQIVGRLVFRVWPLSRFGPIH